MIKRVAVLMALVLIALIALDGVRVWQGIERVDLRMPGAGGGDTNYLLVGSDSRTFVHDATDSATFGSSEDVAGKRADMMLLVHVPANGRPVLLGVPRDLFVDFAGTGQHRLTMALAQGPQVLVDAYCSAFGIGLDHLAILDFDGFRKLVDLVGGIEIDVSHPRRDVATGLDLNSGGVHHLTGEQALAFVRSRKGEELVDGEWRPVEAGSAGRVKQGEDVLTALAPKAEALAQSPWGKVRLAHALMGSLSVDSASGLGTSTQLASALGGAGAAAVVHLPAAITEGPVPTARLEPEAASVLRSVGAGTNPSCPLH